MGFKRERVVEVQCLGFSKMDAIGKRRMRFATSMHYGWKVIPVLALPDNTELNKQASKHL